MPALPQTPPAADPNYEIIDGIRVRKALAPSAAPATDPGYTMVDGIRVKAAPATSADLGLASGGLRAGGAGSLSAADVTPLGGFGTPAPAVHAGQTPIPPPPRARHAPPAVPPPFSDWTGPPSQEMRDFATSSLETAGMILGTELFPPAAVATGPTIAARTTPFLQRLAARLTAGPGLALPGRIAASAAGGAAGNVAGQAVSAATGGPPKVSGGAVEDAALRGAGYQSLAEAINPVVSTGVNAWRGVKKTALDRFGPPVVLGGENPAVGGTTIPDYLSGQATASQTRDNKLLTGISSWVRSMVGGKPLDEAVAASEHAMQGKVDQILTDAGVPLTHEQTGNLLVDRRVADLRQTHATDFAQAERVNDAERALHDAKIASATADAQVATAEQAGHVQAATDLRRQAASAQQAVRTLENEITTLRGGLEARVGAAAAPEATGDAVLMRIHAAHQEAKGVANQLYATSDRLTADIPVSMESAVGAAEKALAGMSDTERALHKGAKLAQTVSRTGMEPVESTTGAVDVVSQAQKIADVAKSRGKGGAIDEAVLRALHDEIAASGAAGEAGGEDALMAKVISFPQARRLRSILGDIAYRQASAPDVGGRQLARVAGKIKDALGAQMQAALPEGHGGWQAYQDAQTAYANMQQLFVEGIFGQLMKRDPRLATRYLARAGSEIDPIVALRELGPDVANQVRAAALQGILQTPTGEWVTGDALAKRLAALNGGPFTNTTRAIFGDAATTDLATLVQRMQSAEGLTARVGEIETAAAGIDTAAGKAQTTAQKAAARVEGLKAQKARDAAQYLETVRRAAGHQYAAETAAGVNSPYAAIKTLVRAHEVKPITDAFALLSPEERALVRTRWLHDEFGSGPANWATILDRWTDPKEGLGADVVATMVPDAAYRNRLYQFARVAKHLKATTPQVNRWALFTQFGILTGALVAMDPARIGQVAATEWFVPSTVAKILADPQAGATFVSALSAGNTATGFKLAGQLYSYLRREGLAQPVQEKVAAGNRAASDAYVEARARAVGQLTNGRWGTPPPSVEAAPPARMGGPPVVPRGPGGPPVPPPAPQPAGRPPVVR